MASNTRRKKRNQRRGIKVNDVLERVDSLPILDLRSADEIVGYDEHGLPAQREVRAAPTDSAGENGFDFEAYRKAVLNDPKAREVIEFFLKYRHREREP
jgi:hypothetical protein